VYTAPRKKKRRSVVAGSKSAFTRPVYGPRHSCYGDYEGEQCAAALRKRCIVIVAKLLDRGDGLMARCIMASATARKEISITFNTKTSVFTAL
jgi:hypothetical protein